MSKKGTQIDMLGETHFPEDLFTPTEASAFGLDSFPEFQTGMGVLDGDAIEGKSPTSGVPGAIAADQDPHTFWNQEDEDGMHLGAFLREKEASLADLAWLDLAEQDPERLPKNPHVTAQPELEEAWGIHRRTDGVQLYANVDLDVARYQASLEANEEPSFKFAEKDLQRVVRKAQRQSAAGFSLATILREAAEALGDEATRIHAKMQTVKAEHGLAGNVFIRASAYPGLHQRYKEWAPLMRKASGARFILYDEETLRSSAHIHGGYCSLTQKRAVSSVPWDEALKHYSGRLQASGRKVASGVHPAAALRRAFLSAPVQLDRPASQRPRHVSPSERVSIEEARRAFAAMPHPERKVYDNAPKLAARERHAAQVRIAKWVRSGLLSREDGARLVNSGVEPRQMLRAAGSIITASRGTAAYSGLDNDVRELVAEDVTREDALALLVAAEQKQKEAQTHIDTIVSQRAAATRYRGEHRVTEALRPYINKVVEAVGKGVRGQTLRDLIARTIPSDRRKQAVKLLAPFLAKTGALEDPTVDTRTYEGPVHRAVQQRVASIGVPRQGEIAALLRWARQKMNEGEAGKDLDLLIRAKFGPHVRTAAAGTLQQLREAHEGAAGYIYVDAAAYASQTGTKGCEKGGLQHRANQLKYVLAMDRCATCALRMVTASGTPRCSQYNKELVLDEQIPHKRLVQATNIDLAQRPDYEQTAAMFAPAYDASEFNLHNSNLDDIDFEHSSTSTEELSEILFGGMEWTR